MYNIRIVHRDDNGRSWKRTRVFYSCHNAIYGAAAEKYEKCLLERIKLSTKIIKEVFFVSDLSNRFFELFSAQEGNAVVSSFGAED
jgi:hypothetical protein